jgi:nucleoside 2-deoxyribosyltransferase
MTAPKVYLAGPDVFLPDPAARAAAQKRICARHGLVGISPLDGLADEPSCWAPLPEAHRIALRNEAHIRASDAILANLTPFRGPSADAGTVYEIGFGRALGLKLFGYSAVAGDYASRVRRYEADGLTVEDFGLIENLMIACGIEQSGGTIVSVAAGDPWGDLDAFEQCVALAAAALLGEGPVREAAKGE